MLAVMAALALFSPQLGPTTPPSVGALARNFTLPSLHGAPISLSNLRGHVVVVNFFATWCPPCRAETPDLIAAEKHYTSKGIVFLGVDDRESALLVAAFVKSKGIRFPILLDADGRVSRLYDVRAIPSTYVLDRLGFVRFRQVDQLNRATLAAVLDATVNGRALPQSRAASRFGLIAERITRQLRAITATATSALAARNFGVAETDSSSAIKLGTSASTKLEALQSGPDSSSIDYFKSTRQRDTLSAALANVYDVRARALQSSAGAAQDAEQAALLRGQIAEDAERFIQAEQWYAKAIALAPNDVKAYDGEYLAAYEMRDYVEAAQAAQARAKAAPADPESWLTVASAQMSLKRFPAALDAARQAVSLATADYARYPTSQKRAYEFGRVWLKMARVEVAAGNQNAAKPLLRNAMAAAPSTIVAGQAQEQLAALSPAAVSIALAGAGKAVAGPSSSAALFVNVRNPDQTARAIHLASRGLPPHWVLSFCYGTVCDPNKSTLTLAAGASRRVELQVVPLSGAGGRWTMSLRPTGRSTLLVGIEAKSVKAAITVWAS